MLHEEWMTVFYVPMASMRESWHLFCSIRIILNGLKTVDAAIHLIGGFFFPLLYFDTHVNKNSNI